MNPCYILVDDQPHEITRESSASIWTKPVTIRNGQGGIERLEVYGTEKCFNRETLRERGTSLRRARLGRMLTGAEALNHLREQQRQRQADAQAHKAKVETLAEQLGAEWQRISRHEQFSLTALGPEHQVFRLKVPGTNYRRPGAWEVFAVIRPAAYRNSGYEVEAAGVFVGKDDQGEPAYATGRLTVSLTDPEHGKLFTKQMALARLVQILQRD